MLVAILQRCGGFARGLAGVLEVDLRNAQKEQVVKQASYCLPAAGLQPQSSCELPGVVNHRLSRLGLARGCQSQTQ